MTIRQSAKTAAAIQQKARAFAALFSDPAATEHEKANARRLKARVEEQLPQEPTLNPCGQDVGSWNTPSVPAFVGMCGTTDCEAMAKVAGWTESDERGQSGTDAESAA